MRFIANFFLSHHHRLLCIFHVLRRLQPNKLPVIVPAAIVLRLRCLRILLVQAWLKRFIVVAVMLAVELTLL